MFLRVPGRFLSHSAVTGQTEGFWGPVWVNMGGVLTPLGLSVAPNAVFFGGEH